MRAKMKWIWESNFTEPVSWANCQTLKKDMMVETRHALTHQRSNNTRDTIHGAKEPLERRTLFQRLGNGDDEIGARKDARRAQASNGSPDDEGGAAGRDAADEGAELENGNGGEEDPFHGEKGEKFAEDELEGGGSEEVGWYIDMGPSVRG